MIEIVWNLTNAILVGGHKAKLSCDEWAQRTVHDRPDSSKLGKLLHEGEALLPDANYPTLFEPGPVFKLANPGASSRYVLPGAMPATGPLNGNDLQQGALTEFISASGKPSTAST